MVLLICITDCHGSQLKPDYIPVCLFSLRNAIILGIPPSFSALLEHPAQTCKYPTWNVVKQLVILKMKTNFLKHNYIQASVELNKLSNSIREFKQF